MVADDAIVVTSTFDASGKLRHERRCSNSTVGRGGFSPVSAQIHKRHYTRDERIRIEFRTAVADGVVDQIHSIYQREHTKLPLQNREIYTLRKEVAGIIKKKLEAAARARVDPEYEQKPNALAKELKKAVQMANKQDRSFPYATEVLNLKVYKECLEALSTLETDLDGDSDSATGHGESAKMSKSVSFGDTGSDAEGGHAEAEEFDDAAF